MVDRLKLHNYLLAYKTMNQPYNPPSHRNLSGFIGELTASVAGTQAALLEVDSKQLPDKTKLWESISRGHGIKLNGATTESLLLSHSRIGVVSIYCGFDFYVSELKKEYRYFYEKDWNENTKDSPIEGIKRNCPNKSDWTMLLKPSELIAIDYYRLLRNSIVHPRNREEDKIAKYYIENKSSMDEIRNQYEMKTAPNSVNSISFHDIKLLSRLILDISSKINVLFTPTDEMLANKLPEHGRFNKLKHDGPRRRKSIVAFYQTEYGLKNDHANRVTNIVLAY